MRQAAVLLLVVPVIGGCGGGGGGRLSRSEFDSKGNAVCAKYNAKERKVPRPKSLDDLSPALRKLLELNKSELDELGKLEPPKSDQAAFDRILQGARAENDVVEHQLIPAAEKRDAEKVRSLLQRLQLRENELNDQASTLGLSTCAQNG